MIEQVFNVGLLPLCTHLARTRTQFPSHDCFRRKSQDLWFGLCILFFGCFHSITTRTHEGKRKGKGSGKDTHTRNLQTPLAIITHIQSLPTACIAHACNSCIGRCVYACVNQCMDTVTAKNGYMRKWILPWKVGGADG